MLFCIESKYEYNFSNPKCVVTKQLITIENVYLYIDYRRGVGNQWPHFFFKYIYFIIVFFSWLIYFLLSENDFKNNIHYLGLVLLFLFYSYNEKL